MDPRVAAAPSLRERIGTWTGATQFTLESTLDLGVDVGHPQGLCRIDDRWWLTTVDLERRRGALLVLDASGALLERVELTDGERHHPGGCDRAPLAGTTGRAAVVVALAEYRPHSTTVVCRVDADDLSVTECFAFDDHLGAIVELPTGGYLAGTWGSREFIRFDADGAVVDRRVNPSHYVDVQDLQVLDEHTVFCSGIGWLLVPDGLAQLGGVALLDVDTLQLTLELPVHAHTPTGRTITYNPVTVHADAEAVRLSVVPDDGHTSLRVYRAS
jgi:Family of unknown function (DUF6454)